MEKESKFIPEEEKKADYVPLKPGEKVTRIDIDKEITEEEIQKVKKDAEPSKEEKEEREKKE